MSPEEIFAAEAAALNRELRALEYAVERIQKLEFGQKDQVLQALREETRRVAEGSMCE